MARGNKKGEQKITKPSTSETTKKSSSPSKSVSKRSKGTSSAASSKDKFLDKATGKGPIQTTPEQFFNQTFDSNLYRNSRVVVPVDLQIYVCSCRNDFCFLDQQKQTKQIFEAKGLRIGTQTPKR